MKTIEQSCSRMMRLGFALLAGCALVIAPSSILAQKSAGQSAALPAHTPGVLQVGTYHGKAGHYASIQAAVNAAVPGDWILIAPGAYHEKGSDLAGVLITTPGLHLRGMNRNGVVVDGTNAGYGTCSPDPAAQDFGVGGGGRNGIEIFQVDGVSVENLTVCNFLGDPFGSNGNQIWWNGGDGSGQIGMGSYSGAYLTASSTFFQPGSPTAQYGIFASNAKGPGLIEHSYASNMGDSAFYVGACADCNADLRYVRAQNSPQGYSGTNAGGHLVLEFSEWDHNQAGIVPSALANDDPPSPQDGACPNAAGKSCTLIQFNYVHDNNNPNTPAAGLAATVPVGTGIDLTGGRNNTVQYNLVTNNGSWGVLLNDYPDYSPNTIGPAYCQGGVLDFTPPTPYDALYEPLLPIPCYFPSFGNRVRGNVFQGNGFFGNETNGDLANAALPYSTNNCFQGNFNLAGTVTSSPANLQSPSVAGVCGKPWNPDTVQEAALTEELGCAAIGLCTDLPFPLDPAPVYPVQTGVQLIPISKESGMANPCAGVPRNSWCQ
jgi:hypothetical protein